MNSSSLGIVPRKHIAAILLLATLFFGLGEGLVVSTPVVLLVPRESAIAETSSPEVRTIQPEQRGRGEGLKAVLAVLPVDDGASGGLAAISSGESQRSMRAAVQSLHRSLLITQLLSTSL